jgi:hypothetical protein
MPVVLRQPPIRGCGVPAVLVVLEVRRRPPASRNPSTFTVRKRRPSFNTWKAIAIMGTIGKAVYRSGVFE